MSSIRTTIPPHDFQPAKRATNNGAVDDPRCGYYHRIRNAPVDGLGTFCGDTAGSPVHHGHGVNVRVRIDEEEGDN